MSDANTQEPTMEEILASIRRIISEDDAAAAAAAAAAAPPAPEPEEEEEPAPPPVQATEPEPEPEPEAPVSPLAFAQGDDDDVLELTDPAPAGEGDEDEVDAWAAPAAAASAPAAESLGDIDVLPPPARAPRAAEPAPALEDYEVEADGLISGSTADIAASAFGQLSRTLTMPAEGRTLEGVVRELLRPLLKDWLDQNLPGIVEAAVRAEVERVSRLRR
jgi:cell pole-organizing protein PopZ